MQTAFTISAGGYTARLWTTEDLPVTAWKLSVLLHYAAKHNAFFSDYVEDEAVRRANILRDLASANSILWEVTKDAPAEGELPFVGILRLTEVRPGEDATAHYFFFDRRLSDKTPLLQAWADWAFTDHEGWKALERCSVYVPGYMHALAAHAQRHLGMTLEGRKRNAHVYGGQRYDGLLLGKLKEDHVARS